MAINLIEDIGAYLGPGATAALGGAAGLTPDETNRVAKAAIPTLLGGIVARGRDAGGASEVLEVIGRGGFADEGVVERLGRRSTETLRSSGQGLLEWLFGERERGVVAGVSRAADAERRGTERLMAMLAPLVMGELGRHVRERQLDANGLRGLLLTQHAAIDGLVPDGAAELLGLEQSTAAHVRAFDVESRPRSRTRYVPPRVEPIRTSKWRAWPWAALTAGVLGAGLLAMWLVGRSAEPEAALLAPSAEVESVAAAQAPERIDYAYAIEREPEGRVETHTLRSEEARPAPIAARVASPVETGVVEAGVIEGDGIDDIALAIDEETRVPRRFTLPELDYAEGALRPRAGSEAALDALAATLRARDDVRFRIEGHTDEPGAGPSNGVAHARALFVRDELIARDVAPDRIEAASADATESAGPLVSRVDVVLLPA